MFVPFWRREQERRDLRRVIEAAGEADRSGAGEVEHVQELAGGM